MMVQHGSQMITVPDVFGCIEVHARPDYSFHLSRQKITFNYESRLNKN